MPPFLRLPICSFREFCDMDILSTAVPLLLFCFPFWANASNHKYRKEAHGYDVALHND